MGDIFPFLPVCCFWYVCFLHVAAYNMNVSPPFSVSFTQDIPWRTSSTPSLEG